MTLNELITRYLAIQDQIFRGWTTYITANFAIGSGLFYLHALPAVSDFSLSIWAGLIVAAVYLVSAYFLGKRCAQQYSLRQKFEKAITACGGNDDCPDIAIITRWFGDQQIDMTYRPVKMVAVIYLFVTLVNLHFLHDFYCDMGLTKFLCIS